ncbi:bifunctional adenosine 5'-phosphosulfate phosphorylase/adenylylsulfatase HINT4 isoform X1 [Aristolochia californica]|uniref:bifunctional adenosine 5'-phosphosulfate phosphorylase/adenylylsulfatase HINT4 isoform X1 n=1 Tax=Aristolochia californica TaxID=171875 RepID=UPI0035D6B430
MATASPCLFCQIARAASSTPLIYSDERVVAFQDINPSAYRHYLVIPVKHIGTVKDLNRRIDDYNLVNHMLKVGQSLLQRDAHGPRPYRFGFHQPPFNSVDHLHLHCLALPFIPRLEQMETFEIHVNWTPWWVHRGRETIGEDKATISGTLVEQGIPV